MSFNTQFTADEWHKEALDVTVRNSVQPRRWGMRVTVYNDPTPANNGDYVLSYGEANTNRQDNANWLKVADIGATWGGGGGGSTTAKNQAFNFTGVESAFTVNNGTLNQINFVEVNGVVQIPTTNYSVAGQIVDFTTAIPGTGTVVVYYYENIALPTDPDIQQVLVTGNDAGGQSVENLASINTLGGSFDIIADDTFSTTMHMEQNVYSVTMLDNSAVPLNTFTMIPASSIFQIGDGAGILDTKLSILDPFSGIIFEVFDNASSYYGNLQFWNNGIQIDISSSGLGSTQFYLQPTALQLSLSTATGSSTMRFTESEGIVLQTNFPGKSIQLLDLPTSAAGLPSKSLWNNGNVINITP